MPHYVKWRINQKLHVNIQGDAPELPGLSELFFHGEDDLTEVKLTAMNPSQENSRTWSLE